MLPHPFRFPGTRRRFLQGCSAFAAATALAPLGALGESTPIVMQDKSLNELSYGLLAAQLHTTFRVHAAPGRAVDLELIEARLAPAGARTTGRASPRAVDYESFSLVFCGAPTERLEQRIHRFEHGKIGRFELFIVPIISRDSSRAYYEAVFNRPRQGSGGNGLTAAGGPAGRGA
jgi:hypothetical protein